MSKLTVKDLLDLKDTSLITLKEELNISKRYLDIMTLRFSDHLAVAVNIEKDIEQTHVALGLRVFGW